MKSKFLFSVLLGLAPAMASALPLTGLYQTIDDETKSPKAIVALYEYTDDDDIELAGRIVATYDADGNLVFDSKHVGTDIIWDMEWDAKDNRYEDGKIKDPKSGKVYKSVIWQGDDKTKLNVRGKIGPFGRTQVWNVVSDTPEQLKNLNTAGWMPVIQK